MEKVQKKFTFTNTGSLEGKLFTNTPDGTCSPLVSSVVLAAGVLVSSLLTSPNEKVE